MNKKIYASLAVAALALGLSSLAHAQLNLANTGVDVAHDGFDDNYFYLGTTATVGTHAALPGTNAVIADPTVFPISTGNWFADTASSSWLRPGTLVSDASASTNSVSTFVFATSFFFDATVFNLSTASITIDTAADNELSVYLNSESSALFGSGVVNNSFPNFNGSFTLDQSTGLQAGENTLFFYDTNITGAPDNAQNPAGIRVELDSTVTRLPSAVPEPSTYGLIGSVGLLGLVALRSRRKR
jgi:PEP-CTERM motif